MTDFEKPCPSCGVVPELPCPTCGGWPHQPCIGTHYDDLVDLGLSPPAALAARIVDQAFVLALAPFAAYAIVKAMRKWLG